MVKGTSKRVIVVKSPDPKYFEEAIFIVREEFMRSPGVTKDKLLNEAIMAADGYMGSKKPAPRLPVGLVIALSSLGGTGIGYAALKLLGV